jgi:hypothetical protein
MSLGGSAKKQKTEASSSGSSTESQSGTQTQQTILNMDAINKIIEDTLGQAGGLKDIFGGEQASGLFDSTVATQLSGNFAAQLVGELAKLTSKTEVTNESQAAKDFRQKSKQTDTAVEVSGGFGGFGGSKPM